MKKFYWSALSDDNRHKAIQDTILVVNRYGVLNSFLRCSDLSLGLSIDTEERYVERLYLDLAGIMTLTGKVGQVDDRSSASCMVLLNLTFLQGTGELEIENPGLIE